MTLPAPAAPTADHDRLPVMDILRGFALLGIFLMNIEFFTRTLQSYSGGVSPSEGWDHVFGLAIYVAVQGKFWVLFALLFGMGFALMRDRASATGRPFFGMYLRRTLLLALFGALHIAFVWVGDILLAYAITALLLMMFAWLRGGLLEKHGYIAEVDLNLMHITDDPAEAVQLIGDVHAGRRAWAPHLPRFPEDAGTELGEGTRLGTRRHTGEGFVSETD